MEQDARSKAWMLGPKAENQELFEKLLLEAFHDYCYWRRNFHPEDLPYVTAEDRRDAGYQAYEQELRERLFAMLARLKLSVPFFSPRYVGHMLTDQLIPGFVGYISAMLYNQNNLYEEIANVTMTFEAEAMERIGAMLGLALERGWGHLCSGGSAANTEALWVARNVRMLPYQVALTLVRLPQASEGAERHLAALEELPLGRAGTLENWKEPRALAALEVGAIVELREALEVACRNDPGLGKLVEQNSVGSLGLANFAQACRTHLGDAFPREFRILLSQNAHYSLQKSVGIVGLGEDCLIRIPVDRHLRMDTGKLREAIRACHEREECVLAVVGVYGSTEVAALDAFDEILEIREECRGAAEATQRGEFWLHADACYGGYAAAMARPPGCSETLGEEHLREDALAEFLNDVARVAAAGPSSSSGAPRTGGRNAGSHCIWGPERRAAWLRRTGGLGGCDSISIDPHKLGYIPYPAGAVLYRQREVREFIKYGAPYLNAASGGVPTAEAEMGGRRSSSDVGSSGTAVPARPADSSERPSWYLSDMGKYTLEGSRPGAYAAAVWLAHETVPLDQGGHGWLVARSVLGAFHLQAALRDGLRLPGESGTRDGIGCAFVTDEPDLNMVCYTFPAVIDGRRVPLAVVNQAVQQLYDEFLPNDQHPTQTQDFVLAKTSLDVAKYGRDQLSQVMERLREAGMEGAVIERERIGTEGNPWRDDDKILFVRTVVMGPFLLEAKTRPKMRGEAVDLAAEYTQALQEALTRLMREILNRPLPPDRRPRLTEPVVVLEDDPRTRDALVRQLSATSFAADPGRVLSAGTLAGAQKMLENRDATGESAIRAALIDVQLGGEDEGGLTVLQELLPQPDFKGAVVFTVRNDEATLAQVRDLGEAHPTKRIRFHEKPDPEAGEYQARVNQVMEDLWAILYQPPPADGTST